MILQLYNHWVMNLRATISWNNSRWDDENSIPASPHQRHQSSLFRMFMECDWPPLPVVSIHRVHCTLCSRSKPDSTYRARWRRTDRLEVYFLPHPQKGLLKSRWEYKCQIRALYLVVFLITVRRLGRSLSHADTKLLLQPLTNWLHRAPSSMDHASWSALIELWRLVK